jgi:hypothetical protein
MYAQPEYPRVSAVLDAIADWVKHRRSHRHGLDGLPDSEVHRIAHDMGISSADLRALDRLADQPLLLPQMLAALHIDPDKLSKTEPMMFRDLQRVCAMCDSKKRCSRELNEGNAAVNFEDYCPNSLTLKAVP